MNDNSADKNNEQVLLDASEQLVLEHPSYKQLAEKLSQAEQQAHENWDNWLRTKAELENLQRRTAREIANAHKYALEKFANEILVVVDNLERSLVVKKTDSKELKEFYDGIELTLKLILEILQKFEITPVHPLGQPFDPKQHMAVTTKEDDDAQANIVLEVIQKGYWLKDRLLRPALVVVAK